MGVIPLKEVNMIQSQIRDVLLEIKKKNQEIISNFLVQELGEGWEVEINWGFPIVRATLNLTQEEKVSTWELTFNLVSEKSDFNLRTKSSMPEEWNEISSSTMSYLMNVIGDITAQLFTTNPQLQPQPQPEIDGNESESEAEAEAEDAQPGVVEPEDAKAEALE
jgi:hypothetical protein